LIAVSPAKDVDKLASACGIGAQNWRAGALADVCDLGTRGVDWQHSEAEILTHWFLRLIKVLVDQLRRPVASTLVAYMPPRFGSDSLVFT
jgi:hypothetical protein